MTQLKVLLTTVIGPVPMFVATYGFPGNHWVEMAVLTGYIYVLIGYAVDVFIRPSGAQTAGGLFLAAVMWPWRLLARE